jgi:eukaryotic-like serine/threonine-protein kinase
MTSAQDPNNREPGEDDQETREPEPSKAQAGGVIGPYHLLQLIGEGGMGQVWLAEQKQPVRRRVALKLIKAGMDTREVVARFQSERQALALMDHPAIAKVFDAGSTTQGRPYFVMEYVAGMPITTYADKRKLTTRQRLELFMLVCDGVQHAHQKAIIHRDLKPSNILVSEVDGKPMPRIIDFGVAKATSQRLGASTVYTQLGSMIGTMGYMSPEQADSGGEDIDTRSDVYSLGVVLFELLVGVLPHDFQKIAYNEVLRRLREDDAPRPSTKLRTLGGESATTAQNRGADATTLTRQLRGDPDAITLKALEKDRKRRYGTPSELAADIGRYLRNEPVIAHPPSVGYRAGKYIRRHRLGVAMAAAVLLILVGFAIAQTVALRRITRERDRADRITEFMTNMFKVSSPNEARGNTVTAREILDKASNDIESGLSNDPELQAKMMYTMGVTYGELGLYSQARSLDERALEIQRRILGPRNPDTLRSMRSLGALLAGQGHHAEAEKLNRETLEIERQVLGPNDRFTLRTMNLLASNLENEGHLAEAEKLEQETFEAQRRVLGPEHRNTLDTAITLAELMEREGRYEEAEKLQRETLEIERRTLGPDHPQTLNAMNGLANTLEDEGNFGEAEKLHRDILETRRRVLGPEHPDTLHSMNNLGAVLLSENRFPEAERLYSQALEIQRKLFGPENPDTLMSMNNLASTFENEGRYADAEKLHRQTLDIQRRVLGPDHPNTLIGMENVAIDVSHEGRYAEASTLFHDAIQRASKSSQPGVLDNAWYYFGCMAASAGHRDEAFEYLSKAIDLGFRHPETITGESDLKTLHGDPRFEALVAKASQSAAQSTP